jgi:peptide-methionine (R)-S-oxide reductase
MIGQRECGPGHGKSIAVSEVDIMERRTFIKWMAAGGSAAAMSKFIALGEAAPAEHIEKLHRTNAEWKKLLTPEQYYVLREEGTERPYSSPLNEEKRDGLYVCAACELPLFPSKYKFDSGTGWPSFYDVLPGHVETKTDFKLIVPRTEYHCARCGGHQGHVFHDGPPPTGLRYCNDGVALKFIPGTHAT